MAGFYRTCVIDGVLEHSPAEHVRRPAVPAVSPTLGFTHLQFEALLTAARESANRNDFALVAMLGLLGLRIFEASSADIGDLGEEHGHRVLRVCGKGGKVVLVPLPPAVGRAIDRAIGTRTAGAILLNSHGGRMDRHAATRRLRSLAEMAGVRITRPHPHMLRHTFVTTMLDAGVDLRDVQIAARHADPRTTMRTTGPARTSTATPTTSSLLHGIGHLTSRHSQHAIVPMRVSSETLAEVLTQRRSVALGRTFTRTRAGKPTGAHGLTGAAGESGGRSRLCTRRGLLPTGKCGGNLHCRRE